VITFLFLSFSFLLSFFLSLSLSFLPFFLVLPFTSVLLTTHPLLLLLSWKSKAIPLPTLWATPGLKRDQFIFSPWFYYGIRNEHLQVSDIRDGSVLVLIMVLGVGTVCTSPHPLCGGSE